MDRVAILTPSYRRRTDLENVMDQTCAPDGSRFIVVANYPPADYADLVAAYGDRATFIDETTIGKLGGVGAYNLAFQTAREQGFDYCVLFADDVVPYEETWLQQATSHLEAAGAGIGIFSTDEGHPRSFGWNIIKDAPIGHFLIARMDDLDIFFDPKYRQYVTDLEIIVRNLRRGLRVALLPVRLHHFRSPLNREVYGNNYELDVSTFLSDYPEYVGWLNSHGNERFLPEGPDVVVVEEGWSQPATQPWPAPSAPPLASRSSRILARLGRGRRALFSGRAR